MSKKRNYSTETLQKFEAFLTEFKKDPTQNVEQLCMNLKVLRSPLYEYLRATGVSLADIRSAHAKQTTLPTDIANGKLPVSTESKAEIVAKIDGLRQKGFNIQDAVRKSKTKVHVSTYYNYKHLLEEKATTPKVATKKTKLPAEVLTVPHVIEYVKPKPKKELMLLVGSPETVMDFVKKFREE